MFVLDEKQQFTDDSADVAVLFSLFPLAYSVHHTLTM